MARKKKDQPKKAAEQKQQDLQTDASFNGDVKTRSIERTLDELLFVNVDYTDIDKLRKLRRINRRKHVEIFKKLKDCLNEAI